MLAFAACIWTLDVDFSQQLLLLSLIFVVSQATVAAENGLPLQSYSGFDSFQETKNVSTAHGGDVVGTTPHFELADSLIDGMKALSVIGKFMDSHRQPWVKHDIDTLLSEASIAAVRQGKFVGLHVRRGDKLRKEAKLVELEVYLERAVAFLSNGTRGIVTSVADISGIWLSSDDSTVLPQLQHIAPTYFPNVNADRVVSVSARAAFTDSGRHWDDLPTKTNQMSYMRFVILFSELEMLGEADIFVGTFSSNVARRVFLMRDANGLERDTAIGADSVAWHADGRYLQGTESPLYRGTTS